MNNAQEFQLHGANRTTVSPIEVCCESWREQGVEGNYLDLVSKYG